MNRFAALLDRMAYEAGRNAKIRLMADYFRTTPDPERGYALAALTGVLSFANAKPGLVRTLIMERADPVLFEMSYDYVGDLSETVALMWPQASGTAGHAPLLSEIVHGLSTLSKATLPRRLADWLDGLDETGRWALLKLITGSMRVGASARLAKTAVASLSQGNLGQGNLGRANPGSGITNITPDDVELVWPGLAPPYEDLFAWVEGRGPRPETTNPAPFRPVMLAHAIEEADFSALRPQDFTAEWKWDGIRVQAVAGTGADGLRVVRLYSRTGEDISAAFPDLADALAFDGAMDGELLIVRDGRVEPFNVLQQRLNRKAVTARMLAEFPAHIRAYDLMALDGEDLRALPFTTRRARLAALVARLASPRIDLSAQVPFATWDDLARARRDPAAAGAGPDAGAVEGVMMKRADSPYLPGRPKGLWWKWKRDPHTVDAVLMYAQRGHGKRSSFYSDYTFGVWTPGDDGADMLVPVGKAYFGFTDEELKWLDRYVRNHTVNRFGPVRETDRTLVLEVAFDSVHQSRRHKSGLAMRFPRIHRIRADKPAHEADRIEALRALVRD